MKIAMVSLDQYWEDKAKNYSLCLKYIKDASEKGAELVIFPEMTLTGFSTNIGLISEGVNTSETIRKFSADAKQFNIAIIFGVVLKNNNESENKSIFISNEGLILGGYTKIHSFSFAGEDACFKTGDEVIIIKYKSLNIGLSICYDLRFPEVYTSLAFKCDLIVNIANWPGKRVEHWNALLKARAIENQMYIVGVNRIGTDGNGLEYIESSNAYNANGEIVSYESFESLKIVEIDKTYTENIKEKFNTVSDRRTELYKSLL
jgi:omega-amidase